MIYLPVILMGVSSIVLQILCLRQLLSTFSGNELVIGITFAVWLMIVSLGSFAGSRINNKNAFGLSFISVALVSQFTIILIKSVRPVAGFELGEVIPLVTTVGWTVLSMAVLCAAIGIQFPLAVSYLKERAPEVYSFEAAGAFAGGVLFTFLFAGRMETYTLAMIVAIINILVSFYLMRKKIVLLLLILPAVLYMGGAGIMSFFQYEGVEFVKRAESRYGEITVLKIKDQLNVYSSEKFLFSYPDHQTEETKAHFPMSIQPSAGKVLIVGGSPAVIREFLKYPVDRIDFIETDPVLMGISRGLLSMDDREYLDDKRVKLLHTDARKYIKSMRSPLYDLIVLNIPEPSTANINRYYTSEFFKEAKSALDKRGVLFLSLPVSYGYIGRRMQMANGSVYASLKEVFPYLEVSSAEYGIFAASQSPVITDPDTLAGQFNDAAVSTAYFRPYLLKDAFDPLKRIMVKGRLGKVKVINTDPRPVSYLYNLMLWSEIHGGKWLNLVLGLDGHEIMLFIGAVLAVITFVFIMKGGTVSYTMFTTGYVTMAFSLVLILAYQAYSGYVYEMIGLLTGTFMLGGAAGAYIMRDSPDPLKWLRKFDVLAVVLMIFAILFMNRGPVFYMLIFAAGLIGGGQFAAASLLLKKAESSTTAGKLYAIDLFGSFLGSFLTAIFMVPLTGIRNTILFLIFMKALSFVFLIRYKEGS